MIARGAVSPIARTHRLLPRAANSGAGQTGAVHPRTIFENLHAEFPELRKRYRELLARGYFCATVGVVGEGTI